MPSKKSLLDLPSTFDRLSRACGNPDRRIARALKSKVTCFSGVRSEGTMEEGGAVLETPTRHGAGRARVQECSEASNRGGFRDRVLSEAGHGLLVEMNEALFAEIARDKAVRDDGWLRLQVILAVFQI